MSKVQKMIDIGLRVEIVLNLHRDKKSYLVGENR